MGDTKSKFKVRVNPVWGEKDSPNKKDLSITHNGYQWTSTTVTKEQAREVVKKLNEWINGNAI